MKVEINIYILFTILFFYWLFDFVLQTDKQAIGKSKNWSDLTDHTFNYSCYWMFIIPSLLIIINKEFTREYIVINTLTFCFITFICHTTQDYFTSRLNSKLHQQGKIHLFFVSVGWDQFLHYIQLILTFQLLTK